MSPQLQIRYDFSKPLSVEELSASMAALDKQFQSHAKSADYPEAGDGLSLHVEAIREGSIILHLVPMLEQLNHLADNAETIAGFVTHWQELAKVFMKKSPNSDLEITKSDAKRTMQILGPVAGDNNGGITIQATEGSTVIVHSHLDTVEANAIQNGCREVLEKTDIPTGERFIGTIMEMYQARNKASTGTGDLAVISELSEKALRVSFADEETKRAVLEVDAFHSLFVVRGQVLLYKGKPKAYLINEIMDVLPKGEE